MLTVLNSWFYNKKKVISQKYWGKSIWKEIISDRWTTLCHILKHKLFAELLTFFCFYLLFVLWPFFFFYKDRKTSFFKANIFSLACQSKVQLTICAVLSHAQIEACQMYSKLFPRRFIRVIFYIIWNSGLCLS